MPGRLTIVLQGLGLVHKGPHLPERLTIGSVDVGRIPLLMSFVVGKLEAAGSAALREPQSRIKALIAIAAAVIVIRHESERVLILQPGSQLCARTKPQVVPLMGIVVMYHHTRVFHHAGAQAIPILAVSAGKRQPVTLLEARLVEQVGRTAEVIKLRGGLVPSHVHRG